MIGRVYHRVGWACANTHRTDARIAARTDEVLDKLDVELRRTASALDRRG